MASKSHNMLRLYHCRLKIYFISAEHFHQSISLSPSVLSISSKQHFHLCSLNYEYAITGCCCCCVDVKWNNLSGEVLPWKHCWAGQLGDFTTGGNEPAPTHTLTVSSLSQLMSQYIYPSCTCAGVDKITETSTNTVQ